MNTQLIIAADLGLLRAYRVSLSPNGRQPHLELVEEVRPEAAHQRMADQLTDRPGRFSKGQGPADVPGDLSAGEQHDLGLEQRRRLVRLLSETIDSLLADPRITTCALAVSAPIHVQVLDGLSAVSRTKIMTVVPLNLAKAEPSDLLTHVQHATSAVSS